MRSGPRFDPAPYKSVVLFSNKSCGYESDRLLAELESMIINDRASPYRVIERRRLDSVLREQGLAASGFLEPSALARAGKIAGADAIVMLECLSSGAVGIRFVDIATGQVVAAGMSPSLSSSSGQSLSLIIPHLYSVIAPTCP